MPCAAPLPMHLCLNVMNRLALALAHDEPAQDGLERLADCLVASQGFGQLPAAARLAAICEGLQLQWRLADWLHPGGGVLHCHAEGDAPTEAGATLLAEELWTVLQAWRAGSGAAVSLRLAVRDEPASGQQHAQAELWCNERLARPALAWRWPMVR